MMKDSLSAALVPRLSPESRNRRAVASGVAVAAVAGDALEGLVFFGSRKSDAGFNAHSAHDFFLLTRGYREFYTRLRAAGMLRRPHALVAALNTLLPPNQLRLELETTEGPVTAKCAVLTLESFVQQTSAKSADHFCLGRMFQPAEIVYSAGPAQNQTLVNAISSAHRLTYRWVRPWLPETFDVDAYYRTLLRVSLSAELRPESASRAVALWEAQQPHRRAVYPVLFDELVEIGDLVSLGQGRFRLAHAVSRAERWRLQLYFEWSRVRATVRWAKYVVTFDDWLEYILRKIQRHSGQEIQLTALERRYPLIFLWPRLIRYMRQKEK